MKKSTLLKGIETEITYDGVFTYECSKCGHAPMRQWVDHISALSANIGMALRLKNTDRIYEIIENMDVTGNKKKDAQYIVKKISEDIIELDD